MMEVMEGLIENAFARHAETLKKTAAALIPDISRAAELLSVTAKSGQRLLVCGNGGSAADAQHLATEYISRHKRDRDPLPALALTVDTSAITAIGNDYGFEQLFARQIKALGNAGDVLVAITTSGKSKNILLALEEAKRKSIKTIVLTGEGGAGLTSMADIVIAIPSTETARIQEMHELIYHAWCEWIDEV